VKLKDVSLLGREAERVLYQVSDGTNSRSNGTLCQWAMPAPLRRKFKIHRRERGGPRKGRQQPGKNQASAMTGRRSSTTARSSKKPSTAYPTGEVLALNSRKTKCAAICCLEKMVGTLCHT
jgi:hypothetical protein